MAIRTAAAPPEPTGPTSREFDVPTELNDARFAGYAATLVALAEAGGTGRDQADARRELAAEVLRDMEELLVHEATLAARRTWRQAGRALVALGHAELWPALFALTDEAAYAHPGEVVMAEGFLKSWEVPVPEPPAGWPGKWAPPPQRAAGDDALRAGVELGARVALAVQILGEGYCPDHVLNLDLGPPGNPGDPTDALTGAAPAAWRAALDRAARLSPAEFRDALAEFLRLTPAPQRAAAGQNGAAT
jgi:hypothetical protein